MMQGERNHPSPQGGIGLGADSRLARDESFVDSSQAEMFLELLKTRDGEEEVSSELAGVEEAVEAIRLTLNELVATLARKRSKTRLVSVAMFESNWLEPSPEQQSCARIDSTEGETISFIGMQNKDFRALSQAMMGISTASEEAQSGPLANSEKQMLGVVADRLIGRLYTASDPIETIGMPASAKICQPEDALDLAERGYELVLVKFESVAGALTLPVEMLFPLEILEAGVTEVDGSTAREPRDAASRSGEASAAASRESAAVKLCLEDVPVSVNCELFSAELPLSEVNRLKPGQMLGEAIAMSEIRILDAENRPFLCGALQVENGRLKMIARNMVKNTSEGTTG